MSKIHKFELIKIPYLDVEAVGNRLLQLAPFWDGNTWRLWMDHEGKLIELYAEPVNAHYFGTNAQREDDLRIPFAELIWQRALTIDNEKSFHALLEDVMNLFASVAKLKAFHRYAQLTKNSVPSSFITTELEFLMVVIRSLFDLLHQFIRDTWMRVQLTSTGKPPAKKWRSSLAEMILDEKGKPLQSAETLRRKYDFPPVLADAYLRLAPFFSNARALRNSIVHGKGRAPLIFHTEKGFGVDPTVRPFNEVNWVKEHLENDCVASLLPWLSHQVMNSIQACNETVQAFAQEIQLPPPIAPNCKLFLRTELSDAVLDMLRVSKGEQVWWE